MKRLIDMSQTRSQRGAATLVVVMVLFLVMALLAAYANRSLMFEQRIAGSYYRASMAQEMGEAGAEWAVAMLNGTAIDGNCTPVATGGMRFVDRYLTVSAANRYTASNITTATPYLAADCASNGTAMTCRCPTANTRISQPSTALSGSLIPSLGVALPQSGAGYGSYRLTSYGCSDSSVDNCASGGAETRSQQAAAASMQDVTVGFIGAVPSSPASPLTVKGLLTTSGAGGLGLHNSDPSSAGLLVVSGGAAPVTLIDSRMDTVPGTPTAQARIFGNSMLATQDNTEFFRTFMGMVPNRYKNHPAARSVTCSGDCGTTLANAFLAGQRIMTVDTAMTIGSGTIGSPAAPVVVVVYGDVIITGPMQLSGLLVVLGDLTWTNNTAAPSQVNGMVVVQGAMDAIGQMDIVYQQSIATALRNQLGSYARVSGGWIDGDIK